MANVFTDLCTNAKSAEVNEVENPLWTREDGIYRARNTFVLHRSHTRHF